MERGVKLPKNSVLMAVVHKCSNDFFKEFDYKRVGVLGRGMMGHVFWVSKPNDRRGKTSLALKTFVKEPEDVEERVKDLFLKEVAILQSIQHKNIMGNVKAYDCPDAYALSMPYYKRGSLEELLSQTKLTVLITDIYLVELTSAVRYLHGRHIVHRDINPANVLLTDKGNLVLTDFGLARRLLDDKSKSVCRGPCGTPGYEAPELGKRIGQNVDLFKCDMYSLGIVLCDMIFGRVELPAGMDFRTVLSTQPYIPAFYKNVGEHLLHGNPRVRWDSETLMGILSSWPPMADLLHGDQTSSSKYFC